MQQYEQFVISEDESIDSAFARYNTIITSLKALDEGYSSMNYVRKFLRALHPKWRAKVTTIEESKNLTSLSLDELIENLKVHEMIIKKDSKIVKEIVERKSLALKAKKESSDEECSNSKSEKEEYAMAMFQRSRDEKNGKSDRKFFRCGDPNHLIGECRTPPKDKNQRAFFRGSWSNSGEEDDEKVKNEMCLVARASSEICLGVNLEPNEWIKDSGCSKHMMSNQKLFSTYKAYNGGNVIFGSNLRGNIIGKGYSQNSKAYIILNKHTRKVKESLNVTFDETPPPSKTSPLVDDDLDEDEAIKVTEKKNLENDIVDEILEIDEIVNIKGSRNHPLENIIGNLNQRTFRNMTIRGTKWVFRNKLDENGVVSRNKARLVAQGYNQQEGINYDETYALAARLKSIRILVAYACALDFKLFQMDVKSAFRNGFINEEKQTALAISTTEAEYVSVGKACQQALWMKQALIDYDVRLDDIPIMCDNKGTIDLSKNSVQHSRTKHIEIRHHFLCDNVQKGHISIKKVPFVDNIADILTKPRKPESFNYLRLSLGMMEHIS
uniref:Retrovirus-related Pol polyprotein from transposon TNT 1-94 n=1 Tax=Tanacetum cinerariifolium TaxID=118510 RepID=A0A6L2K393_TANCI|nr:retrovirus-related Pol polyprotein from transposon TNT 1-94 [Tanacetum cinerariifolium]